MATKGIIVDIEEVIKRTGLRKTLILEFAKRELIDIISEGGKDFVYEEEIDKMKFLSTLIDELDVNMEGAEIILDMRQQLLTIENTLYRILNHLKESWPDAYNEVLELLKD